jgi:hypothetical protein
MIRLLSIHDRLRFLWNRSLDPKNAMLAYTDPEKSQALS